MHYALIELIELINATVQLGAAHWWRPHGTTYYRVALTHFPSPEEGAWMA